MIYFLTSKIGMVVAGLLLVGTIVLGGVVFSALKERAYEKDIHKTYNSLQECYREARSVKEQLRCRRDI